MQKKVILKSEGMKVYKEKALRPTTNLNDAEEMLEGKLGSYPLYAFVLYSEMDEDCADFMRLKGQWLHSLSGEDCLIGVFENPGDWGEGWERYWRERLSSDFSQISAEWIKLKPFDRNTAFSLADFLGVDKNALPCIIFVESFFSKEVLCIPIIADKNNYPKYFQDIFTAVSSAIKTSAGTRLQALRSEWRKLWAKWILPEKIKKRLKSIQEWGSIISKTEVAVAKTLIPLKPMLQILGVQIS